MNPVFTFITSHQRKIARSRLNGKHYNETIEFLPLVEQLVKQNNGVDNSTGLRLFCKAAVSELFLASVCAVEMAPRPDHRGIMAPSHGGFNYSRKKLITCLELRVKQTLYLPLNRFLFLTFI